MSEEFSLMFATNNVVILTQSSNTEILQYLSALEDTSDL